MRVDTSSANKISPFTRYEVVDAVRSSNFNKGLGPDCFDGNVFEKQQPVK